MQRTQVIPPNQNQDQNQDAVVQAACNLHLKYGEYFLFNYSLPIKTIYGYIVEKLETEFHQKSRQLKSGEFLQFPTEDNISTEIKTFCGKYRDKSGSVNLPDKNAEIAEEFVILEETSDKILTGLKGVATEQAFERAIDSMDELLDAIYDYRFEKGYREFAIGEHAELVQFFKDNRWFAQEVVASFPDDSAIQDAQTRSAKKFYEQYDFVTLNESLNDFYKKFFAAYIEAVGIDLSHSSSQKLNELFNDTFNNELDCSPVFLLTVLKDDCQVLVKAIHSKIKEIDAREMQIKEKRAMREQQRQRDLEPQTRRQEVSEEQVKQTVKETRKPSVMERERQKHVVTKQQPLAQAVAKLQRLQKIRVTEKPQPQTATKQQPQTNVAAEQKPQTKVAAKQKPQAIVEQQSKNTTAQNFQKILSAPSAEIKKMTESEEQKEKELARRAHEKQINLLHQQMRQGIEDDLIKQKIKQKQEQQEREKNRMQKIVFENAEKKLNETLAEIEKMVEGGEQKRKEQAVKEQRRQLEIEQQRRREAIEESRQQEIQEQKRKREIEEKRRQEAVAAELKERAIAQQRRPHELQQNAKLFKPAETQKPAVTEDEQVYVNDEEQQVIIMDDEKVVILNAELVLRKLDAFLAQEHHKRNVPDNMSPREFLKFLEDWLSNMKEKKSYLEEKIVLFKELQENEVLTHLFDQKTLIEDIQNVLRELQNYVKLYKEQFSGNDFTTAVNSREEASRPRGNKR